MRYSYKLPSINVQLNDICLPGQDCTQQVSVQLGEAIVEVEGDASELIAFTSSTMKEVKSFIEWLPKGIAAINAVDKVAAENEDND
jgi:hypothetical protein